MSQIAVRVTPADLAPPAMINRMRTPALVVGLLFSIGALVLAAAFNKWDLFLHSWLFAFVFWMGLTTGPLVLLMLQYVTGGNWGRLGRRIWEAAAGNLWLMFAFWLPIALWMKHIYKWADMSTAEAGAKYGVDKVHYYLNSTGFLWRGMFYFVGWGLF
jgi:hypothetical protein